MFDRLRSIMSAGTILGYFLQAVPAACAAGLIYALIQAVAAKWSGRRAEWRKEIIRLLFTCYLTGLVSLVVLPANFWLGFFDGVFLGWWDELLPIFRAGGFNLVPTLWKALSGELTIGNWVKTMLIGNTAMFLPLGFFLPFVTERVDRRNILVAAIVIPAALELLQTVFGRSFDVDDLICNGVGIAAGFFVGLAVKRGGKKSRSR